MIYVLGYQGKSIISKLIRWQTRSKYSHVSIEVDGFNYEAWNNGVVRRQWHEGHTDGTKVDVFRLQKGIVNGLLLKALKAQLGKKYDYKSIARFLSRRKVQLDNKWFCSELVSWSLAQSGLMLQIIPHSYITPRDVCMSPMLKWVEARIVGEEYE